MSVPLEDQLTEGGSSTGATFGDVLSGVGEVAFLVGTWGWRAPSTALELGQDVVDGEWVADVVESTAGVAQPVADAAVAVGELAGEILDSLCARSSR